jgi:hypothetical protein
VPLHLGMQDGRHPWREATVARWDFDLDGTGKMVCEEHRLALDLGEEAEELGMNLDTIHEFVREELPRVEQQEGGCGTS